MTNSKRASQNSFLSFASLSVLAPLRQICKPLTIILPLLLASTAAQAWPEFQAYSQKNSGRGVSCAMCHAHPDGPDGANFGQVGGLDAVGKTQLNEARTAFDPNNKAHNPILNAFGNSVLNELGRTKILDLKQHPATLASSLDQKTDLDDDGIPDAQEYLDGTNPLSKSSGNPMLLAVDNFKKHFFTVIMIILATFSALYGFSNILTGMKVRNSEESDEQNPYKPLN